MRSVITLGTPFTGHPKANNVWRLYEFTCGRPVNHDQAFDCARAAPALPTTSIFSRSDGIVSWPCCLQPAEANAESIEITSSHIGITFNPVAWYAVADRLAQPEGEWRPFHRDGWRKWLFRDPYR